MRCKRLNEDLPCPIPSACPSGHLNKQLKGPFRCSKIFHSEREIGIDYPHQRDIWKVQALGDHLSAHQNVDPALSEVGKDFSEKIFTGHYVRIDPNDDGITGKHVSGNILDSLRAVPLTNDFRGLAGRANSGGIALVTA